jgi:hypothetical protein
MLGFLKNPRRTARTVDHVHAPRFVPITSATPVPKPAFDFSVWRALSCYHGRIVVDEGYIGVELAVWEPVTGHRRKLPRPRIPIGFNTAAAFLCVVGSCNHLDCHGGPFLVVSVASGKLSVHAADRDRLAWACVYSSETDAWGTPTSADLGGNANVDH